MLIYSAMGDLGNLMPSVSWNLLMEFWNFVVSIHIIDDLCRWLRAPMSRASSGYLWHLRWFCCRCFPIFLLCCWRFCCHPVMLTMLFDKGPARRPFFIYVNLWKACVVVLISVAAPAVFLNCFVVVLWHIFTVFHEGPARWSVFCRFCYIVVLAPFLDFSLLFFDGCTIQSSS